MKNFKVWLSERREDKFIVKDDNEPILYVTEDIRDWFKSKLNYNLETVEDKIVLNLYDLVDWLNADVSYLLPNHQRARMSRFRTFSKHILNQLNNYLRYYVK